MSRVEIEPVHPGRRVVAILEPGNAGGDLEISEFELRRTKSRTYRYPYGLAEVLIPRLRRPRICVGLTDP